MITKTSKIFQVECPLCRTILWIDPLSKEIVKSEKGKKKKGSLEEMLLKEKKRKDGFERKFEATAEMQKEKKIRAKEKFKKVLGDMENQ